MTQLYLWILYSLMPIMRLVYDILHAAALGNG